MTPESLLTARDEVREVRDSNIRIEGLIKSVTQQVTQQFAETKFRLDSHDQRIGTIEKDKVREEGRQDGRREVTQKVDYWGKAVIAGFATLIVGVADILAHVLGILH